MRSTIDAQPFLIAVPDDALLDLRERLARTRWPNEPRGPAWSYGTSLAYMREVADYWSSRYDWRRAEVELNSHTHYKANIDGKQVHFLVEIGSGPAPMPLLLTHGWPGSIVEFLDIIDPLAHPELHGGKLEDAFTVIAPSLPGYGFSDPPDAPISPRDIGHIWHKLMSQVLGATRYVAQGGDWGAVVTSWLALDHPGALAAIHLNMVGLRPALGAGAPPPTPEEQAYFTAAQRRREREIAYQQIQGTKPQTLSYGLTDSPIGLAAWILEKFHGWTIPGQGAPPPFAIDRLLTNVMLYWLAGINGANWLYCSIVDGTAAALKPGERVAVPTGLCLFPNDLLMPPPRSWVERAYNVAQYRVAPSGGHFPALENGPLLIQDMRCFFAQYR
jgi:pimeloyl-ACP methyl ester carboxylesterase